MGTATFSSNPNYYIDVDAWLVSQNVAGNYSTIYWRVIVTKTYGYGFQASKGMGNSGWAAGGYVGTLWSDSDLAYNFANGQMTGSWTIADGQFNIQHRDDGNAEYYVNGGLTLYALGSASAGTGWRSLPRIARSSAPPAPRPGGFYSVTQTQIGYWFQSQGDGGSPILEWQTGYGQDPYNPWWYSSNNGSSILTGLKPANLYYFWSRGRNANGWGPWSSRMEQRTLAGARVKYGGAWRDAIPYVKVNGVWRAAEPYIKSGGNWRKSG